MTVGHGYSAGLAAGAVALLMLAGGADSIAGNAPSPRAAAVESLPRAQALQHGPSRGRGIALTFDADFTSEDLRAGGPKRSFYDRDIVRTLRRTGTPATLFVTGLWAGKYPNAVRQVARERLFEFANHTYTHRAWTSNCYGLPRVRGYSAKRSHGGAPVFHMHGGSDAPATGEPLPRVIRELRRRGYRLVTVSELFGREAG